MTTAEPIPPLSRRSHIPIVVVLATVLLLGGISAVQWRVRIVDRTLRDDLLHHATAIARTLNHDEIQSLSFNASDLERPGYQRLREQFIAYQALINCRGIYTLALRNNQLVFGPESYAAGDPHASPPGTIYEQPTIEARDLFHNRQPFTEGPVADEYGTFISAFAPVISPRTGEVLLSVGIDLEATDWRYALSATRRQTVLALLPLAIVVLGGAALLIHRSGLPPDRRRWLRFLEPWWVAATGLTFTTLAVLLVVDHATRARRDSFLQLAHAQASRLVDSFEEMRTHQLGALARFYASSQEVDRAEFHHFTAPVLRQSAVDALAWVRPIPAAAVTAIQEEAHQEGLTHYQIWQPSADGQPEPVSGRDRYYPIHFIEPLAGNESLLGLDLGSDAVLRASIESALRSGLPTAGDPTSLESFEDPASFQLLIFHPLSASIPHDRPADGLLLARLQMDTFLRSALSILTFDDRTFDVDLFQLQPGQLPRFLACSSTHTSQPHAILFPTTPTTTRGAHGATAIFPLFVFGQSYALSCQPGPAFIAAKPWRAAGQTALGGGLITTLLTLLIASMVRHRIHLENRVQHRTAALRESERRLTTLLGNLPGMAYRCDPDRRWTMRFASVGAMQLTGYSAADLIGNERIAYADIIHPDDRERVWQEIQQAIDRTGIFTLEYRIRPRRRTGNRPPYPRWRRNHSPRRRRNHPSPPRRPGPQTPRLSGPRSGHRRQRPSTPQDSSRSDRPAAHRHGHARWHVRPATRRPTQGPSTQLQGHLRQRVSRRHRRPGRRTPRSRQLPPKTLRPHPTRPDHPPSPRSIRSLLSLHPSHRSHPGAFQRQPPRARST
jgi:CHASE1-domain containing sensor protein